MAKENTSHFILMTGTWWITLIAGIALGIISQRILEIRAYTDEVFNPIENNHNVKNLANRIGIHFTSEYYDPNVICSHYAENSPLPHHPVSSFIIHRSGYSMAYDPRTRNPLWVYEDLTQKDSLTEVDRAQFRFKEDENIPLHLRTTPTSYKGRGLDQGQMASPINHGSNPKEVEETFYLTNICPQCPQFNREYWTNLENHIKELASNYKHVYVVTGPLYLPFQENRRKFVKYQVIGPDEIAVPSHFFKVITLEDHQGNREVRAYALPNRVISNDTPLDKFRTSVEKIEKSAGILIFNQYTP